MMMFNLILSLFLLVPLATMAEQEIVHQNYVAVSKKCLQEINTMRANNSSEFGKKYFKPYRSGICFANDTLVDTPDGQVAISKIIPGQIVFSYDH